MFHGVDASFGEFLSCNGHEHFWKNPLMNSDYMIENRPKIMEMISAKTEQTVKNGFSWPWKRHEREGCFDSRAGQFCRHWSHCDQEHNCVVQMSSSIPGKLEHQPLPNTYCTHEFKWEDLMIRERIERGIFKTTFHIYFFECL